MRSISLITIRTAAKYFMTLSLLAAGSYALAQDQSAGPPPAEPQAQDPPASGGWRKVGERPRMSADSSRDNQPPAGYDQADPGYAQGQGQADPARDYPPPARLTIRPGTFVTVRVDQTLSSDQSHPGDGFSATLAKPIVADGVVVAQRGQTLGGRVTEAQKAGRVGGVSRLGLQLTDLSLVDGQQVPIQSQLISMSAGTSKGRDAGAIAGTTALGAAIGSVADWGRGAAIGAGAGAAAGIIGVLLTRGNPTVIAPESVLTFRIDAPVTVSTDRAPAAFRYVGPDDYERPYDTGVRTAPPSNGCGPYGCQAPSPYYGYGWGYGSGYGYYGPYYPYYGPGLAFFYGPRFYGGPRYYYGPRFYGGYHGHGYHR